MSNLLKDLEAALADSGYSLSDVHWCICRVRHQDEEPPLEMRAMRVRPECFFKAAEALEYDPAGGNAEDGVWVVDPLVCAATKDGIRFRWTRQDGVERWARHPDPHTDIRMPSAFVPEESIVLTGTR